MALDVDGTGKLYMFENYAFTEFYRVYEFYRKLCKIQ